jgi:single-stranded-DNA-specific exonuclease
VFLKLKTEAKDMLEKIWKIRQIGDEQEVTRLANELAIDKVLAHILTQRNIKTYEQAKSFFRPDLKDLFDPFMMRDMDKAVERLEQAIFEKEKILIYGDYDVDGTTSVAIIYSFLKKIYYNLDFYIPNRYSEGYGISFKGIDYAVENNCSLIIALDCGIKSIDKVAYATEKNIDVIICDHHTAGKEIPNAVAVLDPKRPDCNYPFKELSGCGVGFKFLQAFAQKNNIPFSELTAYLDLVCVSIASDIVPINGENRILAHFGLKKLNSNPLTGLKSIIKVSGIENKELDISDCVFKIGPRINAAGRIESGKQAVELLICKNEAICTQMSAKINDFNVTRKSLDQTITQEAIEMIQNDEEQISRNSTVLFKSDWHKGVVGIVASRLIDTYYRPTVILTESEGLATGSARSVEGYNLYEAIDACSDLLESFGGHMYAAGLTMKLENLPNFQKRFENFVRETISPQQQIPQIDIDAVIEFKSITNKFHRILKQFAPFGPENMAPIFVTENVKDIGTSRIVGNNKEHLKLEMIDSYGNRFSGIAFSLGYFYESISKGNTFDICYSIEENDYKGSVSLQLMVKDIKVR